MSFSSDVKKELISVENSPCCDVAQSYGILLFGRAFSRTEISILTENSDVAAAYAKAVSILSGVSPDISISIGQLVERYLGNPISKAVVFGGLEPFDDIENVLQFIFELRANNCEDDVVIYTGYTEKK